MNGLSAAAGTLAAAPPDNGRIAGVDLPSSALARDATALARRGDRAIFNHALRSFVFAELFAQATNVTHDSELLYVAAILHDAGLDPQHSSDAERFEVDGANVARALLERHGALPAAVATVWDAIALHDQLDLAKWKGPEVRLLATGVGLDFGSQLELLDPGAVRELLVAAPRTDFVERFIEACAAQVRKKPHSTGMHFLRDIGERRVPGFSVPNFCDAVAADDPFAAFAPAS